MAYSSGVCLSTSPRAAQVLLTHPLTFATSSYDLSFTASDSNVYPLASPDGASIVVYGHQKGLSLFKIRGQESNTSQAEHDQNVVQDHNRNGASQGQPKLEQWLNVELSSSVQHITFPPISAHAFSTRTDIPDLLASNLIVAASCADRAIVLVSIPLTSKQNDDGTDDACIKITNVDEGEGHRDLISSISLIWTTANRHDNSTRSRSQSGRNESDVSDVYQSFLVASASATGSGLLLVHQIPFEAHLDGMLEADAIIARQLVHLPILGSTLAFCSSTHPSRNHLSLLLTSPACGIIKIYNLARSALRPERRKFDEEIDSGDITTRRPLTVSLTLCTAHRSSIEPRCRETIIDAAWVSSGRAILALLGDGEWGLWNIHGLDSKTNAADDVGRFISLGQLSVNTPTKKSSSKTKTDRPLAPMTPHTRKTRSADLFGQANRSQSHGLSTSLITTGKVTLCSSSPSATSREDAIILSYDGAHHYLHSLQAYHRSLSGETTGDTNRVGRSQALPEVRLGGGHRLATHKIQLSSTRNNNNFLETLGETPDLLVLIDTHLVVYTKPALAARPASTMQDLAFRSIKENKPVSFPRSSSNKTLDTEGIDRILDNMEEGNTPSGSATRMSSRRSKLLQLDNQNLADSISDPSSTPTAKSSAKLVIDRKGSSTRRSLFA